MNFSTIVAILLWILSAFLVKKLTDKVIELDNYNANRILKLSAALNNQENIIFELKNRLINLEISVSKIRLGD